VNEAYAISIWYNTEKCFMKILRNFADISFDTIETLYALE